MTKWTKAGLAITAVTVVATAAMAAGGPGRGFAMRRMLGAHITQMEDAIQATPQQRQVIEAARDSIVAKIEAQRQSHQGQQGQWMQLLTADKVDVNAVYAKVDQHAAEMQAMARQIVPELVKVHDALTPAQRQKLAEEMQKHHAGGRHGGPGGFGGPGFGGPADDQ